MGVLNGILGAVDVEGAAAVETVRNWSVDTSADVQQIIASNTLAMPIRLPGNVDWSGSFSCYGAQPVVMPGETFVFTGSIDGAKGCYGPAIADSAEVSIDIESGKAIGYVVNFSGDGALTLGAAVVEDESTPQEETSIGCGVELGTVADPAVFTALDNVRTIGLTFEAGNVNYVSSGTAGTVKRLPGNLNASLSVSLYEGDPEAVVLPNTLAAVRVFASRLRRLGTLDTGSPIVTIASVVGLAVGQRVSGVGIPAGATIITVGVGTVTLSENATATGEKALTFHRFWELRWILLGEASGFEIDREGAAMVGYTLNGGFSGHALIGVTQTPGEIIKPDTVAWWPPVA